MRRYVLQRLVGVIPTLLLLSLAVVLFSRLTPTTVIDTLLGGQRADAASRRELETRLGIDRPLPVAYVDYVLGLPRGDLGKSLLTAKPVRNVIAERINITLELAFFAILIGWSLGLIIGIVSAVRQNSVLDYALRSVAILGLTVPSFVLATGVVLLPALYFGWSPPLGYVSFSTDPVRHIEQFILPACVLAFGLMGSCTRIVRTQMLEVMRQDYIRTARAKGLRGGRVVYRHAIRNAIIPVLTTFGVQVAAIMSGSVIIETIFGMPGLGRLLLESVNTKDWPVVQGVTFIIGAWVILVNLVVDLSYGFLDPRISLM